MPVIPTLSSFPRGPDLVGAASSADQLRQRAVEAALNYRLQQDRLAQEAQSDAMRIQLGREQIEANRIENEMRAEAAQKTIERQALQKQHEQEIQKAYNDARLGLDERKVMLDEEVSAWKIDEASKSMQQQYDYERVRTRNMALGMKEQEASEAAMREVGFGATGFAGSLSGTREPSPFPELNFKARQLDAEERNLMRKYPGITAMTISPEDQTALAEIQTRRRELQIPNGIQTATATNAPPAMPVSTATNAPGAGLTVPTTTTGRFPNEDAARKAGKKTGDVIYLNGIGKVRLK